MTAADWAGLAGLAITFGTAMLGYLQSRRNTGKISEVHVLVNAQLMAALDRVEQLATALKRAGVDVPARKTGQGPPP